MVDEINEIINKNATVEKGILNFRAQICFAVRVRYLIKIKLQNILFRYHFSLVTVNYDFIFCVLKARN